MANCAARDWGRRLIATVRRWDPSSNLKLRGLRRLEQPSAIWDLAVAEGQIPKLELTTRAIGIVANLQH